MIPGNRDYQGFISLESAKFAEISRDPQTPLSGLSQCCTVVTEQYVHLRADRKCTVPGDPDERTRNKGAPRVSGH
jgi:hypothetical protein